MLPQEDLLYLMDLLDLDEELVDSRLKIIMSRKNWTNRHLVSAIQLLKYKQLINIQDKTECNNNIEFDFAVNLLTHMHDGNIEYVCRVMNIVLNLNNNTIVDKSEHILQQILSNINSQTENESRTESNQSFDKKILHLKICDTVLDVIIKNGKKVSLSFLDIPLESIIMNPDSKTFIHFLTLTVPRLFETSLNFNILDKIWNFITQFKYEQFFIALKVLTCLSDFYLPVKETGQNIYESEIVYKSDFWKFILFGLKSKEVLVRKTSVYLAKRAIDYLMNITKDFQVEDEDNCFMTWECQNKIELKMMWDNYFILIDSLEEKQSNIVLPSLKLFECIGKINKCWLDCTFTMGLQHENHQVRFKCIDYKLKTSIDNEFEAQVLLEALNDVNIYDQAYDQVRLKKEITNKFHDLNFFVHIFKAFPMVKWSPVPLCHLTSILSTLNLDELCFTKFSSCFSQIIRDMLKIPCNNILLRTEILGNITDFVGNCCRKLNWEQWTNILTTINFKNVSLEDTAVLMSKMQIQPLKNEEKATFFKSMTDSHTKINYCLCYLYNNNEDVGFLIEVIGIKLANVHDIVQRQYSDKSICWNDIIFLICLLKKTNNKEIVLNSIINCSITKEYKTILQYILCVLSAEIIPHLEEANILFSVLEYNTNINNDCKDILVQIHRLTMMLLKGGDTEVSKKVHCAYVVNNLLKNTSFDLNLIKCSTILDSISILTSGEVSANENNNGRLRNVLNEEFCEIIYHLMKNDTSEIDKNFSKIISFADYMIDCGGCGCLKWILKIVNIVLPSILNEEHMKIDIAMFLKKLWTEIEELKANNQYSPCIKEFVRIITQNELLKRSIYNNIVVLYFYKIIECGALKSTPLYYLIQELNSKDILNYAQISYVLCDILLFSPVPRKDQRIAENFTIEILSKPKYKNRLGGTDLHFNFQIQYISISVICKMKTYLEITTLITKRIDEIFKNKDRYHGNSQHHRTLLTGLQHLVITNLLMSETGQSDRIADWCMKLLGKLPHQPSVRICLEWYIALNYYRKKLCINKDFLTHLVLNNVPLSSQFVILYWILRHKMLNNTYTLEEFEFVMDTLLSHTMGQMFNTRLYAQYLAKNIYTYGKNKKKYDYIIDVIEKTFVESQNEKMYLKLQSDYFINHFDIIADLTPCFVYYFMPRYYDFNNEFLDIDYVRDIFSEINESIDKNVSCNTIKSEWKLFHKSDNDIFSLTLDTKTEMNRIVETNKLIGTIQKKYVPWRNMTDVDVYEIGKKRENTGDLIVVASLIDKLPNLGGMARTSEVFGVKTYVVNSLRHLQDKQFQGLSVSAERWIDIEEVRPGAPLKSYLIKKKTEGYTLVAAEQTSTSCQLQKYKFPRKTLLMLGHEKEGVPCDLLPMMDYCVEIPQKGVVRSLNVHVTAAIFIWEYSRQNIL